MEGNTETRVPALSAREIYQILKDIALGTRVMEKASVQGWDEIYSGFLWFDVDGWRILVFNDCDALDYCQSALSPDGRSWDFDASQKFGTDPVELLSTWEHEQFEKLLKAL